MSYIARREYSRMELSGKLLQAGYPEDEVEQAIALLADRNWQSDDRFAEHLARRRSGSYGKRLIIAELGLHHISNNAATDAIAQLESESDRALKWITKRAGYFDPSTDQTTQREQQAKLFKGLLARGFSSDDIKAALKRWQTPADDSGL